MQDVAAQPEVQLEEDDHGELIWTHLAQVNPRLAEILTKMTRYDFEDRYQSASEALQALNVLSDADVTTPQSVTATNQSLSDDLNTNYLTTVAVSSSSGNESAVPALSTHSNLPSQTEDNQNQDYIYLPIPSPDLKLKSVAPLAQHRLGKQKLPQIIKPFASLAIALVTIVIGGIYFLMQQSVPESPQIPNSGTPRVDQGKGFREDL